MNLDRKTIIGIVLFVAVALMIAYWYWPKHETDNQVTFSEDSLASYTFSQGQNNVAPHDLNKNRLLDTATPAEMARHCNNTPGCTGFNHLGFMMGNRNHHAVAAWQGNSNAGLYLLR